MSGRVELFVAVVDKVSGPVDKVNAASSVVDQFNTDSTGFALVNQSLQTGAAVASVISIMRLPLGVVPIINIQTNMIAGTTTFLKIVADLKETGEVKSGDVYSLAGNVVGTLAVFTALAGAPIAGTVFTAVGVAVTVAGLIDAGFAGKLHANVLAPVLDKLVGNSAAGEGNAWITADMGFTPEHLLLPNYQNLIAAVEWDPEAGTVMLGTIDFERLQGSGNAMQVTGGSTMGPPIVIANPPPPPPARVDIFIESIGGARVGDPYACCGAPQQDKYH